ncbi:MAG: ABC transporter permease [Oscillospiraceae bacterium]|jgi:ABC-2 type transport system permease protein|nr:ABC transporter permease [Oscillospiraceae bacterium]
MRTPTIPATAAGRARTRPRARKTRKEAAEMRAIYRRELRSYFNSMIGYIFTAVVIFFISLTFRRVNLLTGFPYFAYALAGATPVFVLAVPLLTMRSMAEERRNKTDQLLLTYPVSVQAVVLGKYLAMLTVLAVPLLISCVCPLVIASGGSGSFLIDYSAIFAFLCMGGMFISIGMFISSLTDNQIIAAVGSMGALLALAIWPEIVALIPSTPDAALAGFAALLALAALTVYGLTRRPAPACAVGGVGAAALAALWFTQKTNLSGMLKNFLGLFSAPDAIGNFTDYYVFDIKGLLLFISVSALFVFLTAQSVLKRRWS